MRLLGLLQTPERGVNSVIDAALAPKVSAMMESTLHIIFIPFMVELFVEALPVLICIYSVLEPYFFFSFCRDYLGYTSLEEKEEL